MISWVRPWTLSGTPDTAKVIIPYSIQRRDSPADDYPPSDSQEVQKMKRNLIIVLMLMTLSLLAGCSSSSGGGSGIREESSGTSIPGMEESDAGLTGLTVSDAALVFSPDQTTYSIEVPNAVASVTVFPTAAVVNASITVNGVAVASGTASAAIPLSEGTATLITIVVTAGDGIQTRTYTVTVTRLGSYTSIAPLYLHYTLPDQYSYVQNGGTAANEAAALFSGYTLTNGIDSTQISGYALHQFVDRNSVNAKTPDPDGVLGAGDARNLYAVVIRSNLDGFSVRTKFVKGSTSDTGNPGNYNPDLRWDQFSQGYLLDMIYSGRVLFPAYLDLIKRYSVKYAYDLFLFRKIDVKRPDASGSLATFEVSATTDNYVDDTMYNSVTQLSTTKFTVQTISFESRASVRAIPLVQFLTDYVTDIPASYTYKIVGLDGTYKEGWTYADMQNAWYLVDYD
ncbi:cadherin-like beta sandwich domain-containing protein, partial [bacterium]|nr:cadherin-like beta sandwich domain-containing protein [bacterium]